MQNFRDGPFFLHEDVIFSQHIYWTGHLKGTKMRAGVEEERQEGQKGLNGIGLKRVKFDD